MVTMSRLTKEERLRIVQIYFENRNSVLATYRALRPIYGPHNWPSVRYSSFEDESVPPQILK
jgi:hypothetical protein